ncbi:MAG: MFS transporter [Saccharolobus sp.]
MKEDKITKRATEIKGNLLVNFSIPYDTLALLYLAFVIFQSTLALYAQRYYDWGAIQVVIALAIIGLESAILQIVVVPRLINKISAKNTIILGGISMGIGFVMIYLKFIIWVSILIIGLGSSMFLTSGSLLISILVGESRKGEGLGLLQSLNSLMGVIGPIVGGSVFQLYDASQPYLLASIVCLIGSLLLMIKNVK